MDKNRIIKGFSKLTQEEKMLFAAELSGDPDAFTGAVRRMAHPDRVVQKRMDGLTENSISNYFLPYSISPNFLINDEMYHLPMVTEESSVVAAASWAAGFWAERGGFHTRVLNMIKTGQVYFTWNGKKPFPENELAPFMKFLKRNIKHITRNMEERGGGVLAVKLHKMKEIQEDLYQLEVSFNTADSMGANFINSCLEETASLLKVYFERQDKEPSGRIEIIMAILSNYNPGCIVEAELKCPFSDLDEISPQMNGREFAEKFRLAVDIAAKDVFRAVTHNKGIMNGADAVLIATGNDFRAAEAGIHAWASRNGKYSSLSRIETDNDHFHFRLSMPLSIGTVGGVTGIHPLAGWSLKILGEPGAEKLMQIVAAAGLANNFSAVKSLITTGIQQGHMKMHLSNILHMLNADEKESRKALEHFKNKTVSYSRVSDFLKEIRT